MKWSTLLPLALPLLQLTAAWEITWTDANNKQHTRSGHGPSDCIVIDNPKGNLFKIDAQGENGINMLLFTNKECSGKPAGMATQEFSKDSSEDLLGFKVVSTATSTASTSTATGKAGGHNSTSTATTLSSQTASTSGGNGTTTAKTTAGTSTVTTTTTTAETSSDATTTTSSAATATKTNAAVQLAVSNGYLAKGLLGSLFGLAMVQWVI